MYKLFATICVLSLALTARANEVLTNGGFETGTFASWTVSNAGAPGDSFFVCPNPGPPGTGCPSNLTPENGLPTVGPASGNFYAVTDQQAPGTHVITQSFTAQANTDYVLSFDMFVNDYGSCCGTGPQYGGEADLIAGGADPIAAPITTQLYHADTQVVGGPPNPWVATSLDITGDLTAGDTYQIRFLESDNDANLNVGVDDVSLMATPTTATPEPKLLLFPLAFLAGIVLFTARRNAGVV
jgi:hypothetical protein